MRRQSIRFSDEEETIVEQHQRQHHTSSFSKAVLEIIRDHPKIERLEEENTELCAKLEKHEEPQTPSFSNDSEVDTPNNPEPNLCPHRVSDAHGIRCSRSFLKKDKILKVDSEFCNHCWEKQQRLKAQGVSTGSPIPTMYKKPTKIYCIDSTLWIDPLKNQARCHVCSRDRLKMWSECHQKQQEARNIFPQNK